MTTNEQIEKIMRHLDGNTAHDWAAYEKTNKAVKDSKEILINAQGSIELRKKLLDTLLSWQWGEGGKSATDGI